MSSRAAAAEGAWLPEGRNPRRIFLCYPPRIVAVPVAFPAVRVHDAAPSEAPRHPAFVRVTHWISALSFLVLVLSGIAILLAHPRLYWGETGAVGGPSLIDLPLPFVLDVPIRGPGRYLHFLAAWISVFTGLVYVTLGLARRHFDSEPAARARRPRPRRAIRGVIAGHLRLRRSTEADLATYNALQRLSYSAVVFGAVPADDLDRARDVARASPRCFPSWPRPSAGSSPRGRFTSSRRARSCSSPSFTSRSSCQTGFKRPHEGDDHRGSASTSTRQARMRHERHSPGEG